MEIKFMDMVKQIPVRLAELVVKLVSIKIVILAGFFWLHAQNAIDSWALVAMAAFVIFGREALKIVEKFK